MSADFHSPSPDHPPASQDWLTLESRIVAVEAALRALAQSGHSAVSSLVRELIKDFRDREQDESAAIKRAGAVALQCARVMDFMDKRLAAAGSPEDWVPLSQEFANELERLREVAHEHLSAALNRESSRERGRFPVVYLN